MRSSQQNLKESLLTQPQLTEEQKHKERYFLKQQILGGSHCFSKILFSWISALLSYGSKMFVGLDVIPEARPIDKQLFINLQHNFMEMIPSPREGFTLIKAIAVTFKNVLIILMVFFAIVSGSLLYSPVLTGQIIRYLSQSEDRDITMGVILFLATFVTQIIRVVASSHMYFHFAVLGYNLANGLSLSVYSKSLRYPALSEKKFEISEIINYSQVDAERMTYMGYQLGTILFTPIEITVGVVLMYNLVGVAFLSGFAIMLIVMLLVFFSTKKIAKINDQVLKMKDSRMKTTEQMLDIIRFIKVNAIQKYFFRKLNTIRQQELILYRQRGKLQVLNIFLFWVSCPLILAATFGTYTWQGNEMKAQIAFSTIMIFSILQYPIRWLPNSISELVQIFSSIKRIEGFLLAPELPHDHIQKINDSKADFAVKIVNGTFFWGKAQKKQGKQKSEVSQEGDQDENSSSDLKEVSPQKTKRDEQNEDSLQSQNQSQTESIDSSAFKSENEISDQKKSEDKSRRHYVKALRDINTQFARSKFTILFGDIGSGKSSLLLAMLNEMKSSKKSMIILNGSVSYAPQKPWIMSDTLRNNVTFTLPYEKERFERAVHYAALEKDIQSLANGRDTQIGEKGVNLSGGQKARISLARSIYSDSDIYLLDDIISAVDVHVGEFLMRETLLGLLKGKTIIMPTQAIHFAQFADQVVILKRGVIVCKGRYDEVSSTAEFQEISMKQMKLKEKKKKKNKQSDAEQHKIQDELRKIKDAVRLKSQKNQKQLCLTDRVVAELMLPQDQQKGQISLAVFKEYVVINGGVLFLVTIVGAMSLWITFNTLSNIWMEKWCQNPQQGNLDLYIYLTLAISANFFIFVRAYTLILSGVKQGGIIHKKMIKALLYASLTQFYNRVPLGRVINRLTKDLRQLDQAIGFTIGGLLVCAFSLLGTLVICLYASTPFVLIPIFVMAYACWRLMKYYMRTQREVARLEKSTNSPIVSGFLSTINGLATIRAYCFANQFMKMQSDKIELNMRVRITRQALQSWFSIRLSLLSFLVNISAIAFSLFAVNDNPSLAGLLMTYALNLSEDIVGFIFCWTTFENKIVSLERIFNFTSIQPQPGYKQYCLKWRTKQEGYNEVIKEGSIEFREVFLRYRDDLPYVLQDISFKVNPGEKVGIVGRTGAGKSTIVSTLLRLIDPAKGDILVDGININDLPLKDLRNGITMIDQQPTLIKATFRENLDMTNRYSDPQLQEILKECKLYEVVMQKDGLNGKVSNDSLSAGEKQLLCICRAFLKRSKIVLIDQATANIDIKNDEIIQNVIKAKFADSTVLTIAHRLTTLKNSDKILVLGEGRTLQWGTPAELQGRQGGIYAEMCIKNTTEFLL